MICLLKERGVSVVTRLHQRRTADFRRGKRLGPGDDVLEWLRPPRPDLALMELHCQRLARHRVGHRPNRVEPRAVKRRPKPHDLLDKLRAEARAALLRSKP